MPSGGRGAIGTVSRPVRPVIFLSLTLAVITSMDRSVLGLARGRIAADLKLSDVQMGLVFGAFTLAYALCEIPSGFLGDRSGPRPVMLRVTLWWAAFMALTGRAAGFLSLYLSQLFFGAGAAGVYPSVARSFATWLLPRERARAQGVMGLGAGGGGAATPAIMALLFRRFDWRGAFTALSLLGLIWAASCFVWFPRGDRPAMAEVRKVSIPWRAFARSKTVWLLCFQYFALVFSWNFLVSWEPAFIDERFHPDPAAATLFKTLPLLLGGFGAVSSGLISAPLARRLGSLGTARRILACTGFAGASLFLALAATRQSAIAGVMAVALSSFCNDLIMPACWSAAADVAGEWAGTVSGIMNMVGNVGGAIYGFAAGLLLEKTHHDWSLLLYVGAAAYAAGLVAWMFLDPERKIETG